MSETLSGFVRQVKNILAAGIPAEDNRGSYLDLAVIDIEKASDLGSLLANEATPADPLAEVLAITLQQAELGQIDKIKLAINELLKDYLLRLAADNQVKLTETYLCRLKQIFKRCMQADFPFHDEVWDYIGACIKAVGLYLFEQECYAAVRQLLEALAQMGRSAAQKGLPTSNTQACLRALENKAIDKGHPEIALAAKNFRFNMET